MKERPILFSGAMVRAILEGRKSQTRRIVSDRGRLPAQGFTPSANLLRRCPYGQPGDLLWVRETFASDGIETIYAADCADKDLAEERKLRRQFPGIAKEFPGGAWKPSIFMPRRLARLTLRITEIRVQRLHEISLEDVLAEGIQIPVNEQHTPLLRLTGKILPSKFMAKHPRDWVVDDYARFEYAELWESINGKGSWDTNPWVWAITFERVEQGERRVA